MKFLYKPPLLLICLFILNESSFAQDNINREDNSLNHRIIKAYEDGKIDRATMVQNRIYAITNPSQVDPQFITGTPIIEKCATTNVQNLKEEVQNLSKTGGIPVGVANGFLSILARGTTQKYFVSPSGKFRIQYDTSGTNAVYQPTVDVSPADGVPDYVNRTAEIFDYCYKMEVDTLGYTPPPPDGTSGGGTDQYDIYMIHYSGAYGVTFTDGAVSGYGTPARTAYKSYIYVDPNYDGFGYTDRTLPMKVTAAHEYFHAIQFAYNVNAGNWFMEISSTWMEDIVYDNINDYRYYLPGFFSYPYQGLDKFDGSHEYASCIFGHYVSENYGNNRMKRIWDLTVNAGSNAAMDAINTALVEVGTSRSDAFAGFTVWNYLTGSRANGSHPTYSEAAYFPQIALAGSYTSYPVSATSASNLEHLAAHYYQFSPVASPSNLRLGFSQISSSQWKGKVVIDSSSQFKSYNVDLSTGAGSTDFLKFNNKTKAIFIPSNVATTGSSLTYNYTGDVLLPPIVFTPNGSENYLIDSVYNITWGSTAIANIKIEYSTNNGSSWSTVAASVSAIPESYSWIVPNTPTAQALIKVSSVTDANLFDVSDNVFSIQNTPTISLITPNGGETFPIGFEKNIEWSFVNISGNVKIELSRDGGASYETIFPNTPNDGSEAWTVSGALSEMARVRITSISAPGVLDSSASDFYIRNAAITVTHPNGGEVERIGIGDTIKWNSSNMSGNVKIELSRDAGSSYDVIIPSIVNDGQGVWTFTGPTTNNARIRVSAIGNSLILDESDSDFWILPQDFVALQSPIGKENWEADSTYQVKWISYGTSGNVKIELSRDGGLTYETISSSTPDDGLESWIATGPLTAEAQIKITDTVNPSISFSSKNFLIGKKDTATYQSGWNLVSVATKTMNPTKNYIFPNVTSNIFLYNSGYLSVDTLQNGIGYWAKFASDGLNVLVGVPLTTDTVDVKLGWNLIGGLSTPINLQQITSDPVNIIASEYYGYDRGYKTTTTLEPWKAYWVKANQAGKLIMTSTLK